MKETKLSSVIEVISMGPFGSDIKVDNFISKGIPVLNGSNLTSHKLVENSFKYVSLEKANKLGKANAFRGDIIITHRGTLGQVSYIPHNSKFERYVISQSQFRVRFTEDLDPVYFSYLMKSDYGQKKLLSFKSHVGVPALAQATSNFKRLELTLHSITEQKEIATVLSALDDKIELNNQINTELEAMAKTLYDYWFVQFEFPVVSTGSTTGNTMAKLLKGSTAGNTIPELLKDSTTGNTMPELLKDLTTGNIILKLLKGSTTGNTMAKLLKGSTTGNTMPELLKDLTAGNTMPELLKDLTAGNTMPELLKGSTTADTELVEVTNAKSSVKGYRSSGGKMVYDAVLKREIPEGWEVKKLSEVAKTGSGGTPKSTVKEYYENGQIPWINSGELNQPFIVRTENFISEIGLKNSSTKLFPKQTILMAMYGATAGKTSIISFEATTNQAICAVMPVNEIMFYYTKHVLDDMYKYLINLSTGSARDNLSQDKIRNLDIAIPSKELLCIFSNVVTPYFKKIEVNLQQNQELAQLRDWLLPMLMNGQVRVGSGDYEMEEGGLGMVAEAEVGYKKN